jgi:hypothetical protein
MAAKLNAEENAPKQNGVETKISGGNRLRLGTST